jgi:hypothetical protein
VPDAIEKGGQNARPPCSCSSRTSPTFGHTVNYLMMPSVVIAVVPITMVMAAIPTSVAISTVSVTTVSNMAATVTSHPVITPGTRHPHPATVGGNPMARRPEVSRSRARWLIHYDTWCADRRNCIDRSSVHRRSDHDRRAGRCKVRGNHEGRRWRQREPERESEMTSRMGRQGSRANQGRGGE